MKKIKIFFCSFLILTFLSFGAIFTSAIAADDSAGIKISPAIIEERIDPGQVFSSVLEVTNISSEAKDLYIIKKDISGVSEDGQPIFVEEGEETGFELSSWVSATKEPINVPAMETVKVPFTINVPKNAVPGGHFGGLFVSTTPPKLEKTGIGVGFQVGTIISLRIMGEVIEEAQVREFSTDKTIYSIPNIKFLTKVENNGNALVKPRGPMEIKDFFGKKVDMIIVNDSEASILPGQQRIFETEWQGEGFFFGRYEALLSLVYGEDGRKTITRVITFWILPLNIILLVIGIIIGLILVIYIGIKLYIRKRLSQYGDIRGKLEQKRPESSESKVDEEDKTDEKNKTEEAKKEDEVRINSDKQGNFS